MADHTYCYTPAVLKIRELIADGDARRDPVRRLGADQPRPGPARRRRLLGPRAARPVDPRLRPARRAAPDRGGRARRRPARRRARPCVGYLTLPLAGGAIAHVHVNWLSPTKIRRWSSAGAERTLVWDDLNPQQRLSVYDRGVDLAQQSVDTRRPRRPPRSPTGSATPGRRRCPSARRSAQMVDRVRRQHPRGPRAAHRRRRRAARAVGPRGRGRAASATGGAPGRRRPPPSRTLEAVCDDRTSTERTRPGHRRRRDDRLHHRRPAPRRRRRAGRRARQPGPRPAGQPRRRPGRPAGCTLVEGDIRDRDLVHDLTRGKDLVFHQAAIRITQCAEEPRLALEVLVDGTFNVFEAAVERRRRQGRRRVVGVGLRHGRGVPDRRAPPPPQQRHVLRRGQVVQRGHAAQLPRDARPRLRRCCATSTSTARGWTSTASTPRCWSAGWSASPTASRR